VISVDKRLLDKIEIIFLVDNVKVRHNGVIASVIRKMRFIEDSWGYRPLLLVGNYNIELLWTQIMLTRPSLKPDQTQFSGTARIIGVYNYFQQTYSPNITETEYTLKLDDGESSVMKESNVYEIYKNGEHIRTESYTGLFGRLRQVEYLSDGKPEKRVYYDDMGCISMIQHIDKENQDFHPKETYYTTDKKICISKEYIYDPDDTINKNVVTKLTLFKNGHVYKEFTSDAGLAACCLNEVCDNPVKLYFIIDESGLLTPAPLAVTRKNIFRCCVVHNIFLQDAYRLDSEPQRFYSFLCEHRNEFDGIVFLTMMERTDFMRKYPGFDPRKAFAIPHPYPYPIKPVSFDSRNHKKAVIIARFDETKQIPHAISIFKKVVDAVPDAVLEIYGFGKQNVDEDINNKIKELGIENNVKKMGYAEYPAEVIRGASAFLMTSMVEGMPLTLLESISNGCPVFAYDINYGPADTVINGVTGFLFSRWDSYTFAKRLIDYFQDINLQRQLSENCYKDAERFGVSRFIERWGLFMESLYNRRQEMIAKEIADENIAAAEA